MTCSEFIACFSDVQDGTASPEVALRTEEHAEQCASCRRYQRVLERGVEILRSLPEPEVHSDFSPRLRRRLRHLQQEELLHRHTNSGSTALAVLGIAALLTAAAWAPLLRPSAPVVELAPIVVRDPPGMLHARRLVSFSAFAAQTLATPRVGAATSPSSGAATSRVGGIIASAGAPGDLWGDARTLLFQYSRLAQRQGQRSPTGRSGLDQQ